MDYPIRSTGLLAVMLLSCPPAGSAADNPYEGEGNELPSLEFLEFLGSFETDSGEWIGPEELMQPEFDELLENIESAPDLESDSEDQNNRSQSYDADDGDEV